jgi:protein required for attachment to host cells
LNIPKGQSESVNCKSKKNRQLKGQNKKDKQRSTKHITENKRSSSKNSTKNRMGVNSFASEGTACDNRHVKPSIKNGWLAVIQRTNQNMSLAHKGVVPI